MALVKGPNGDVLEFDDAIAEALAKQDGIEIVDGPDAESTEEADEAKSAESGEEAEADKPESKRAAKE